MNELSVRAMDVIYIVEAGVALAVYAGAAAYIETHWRAWMAKRESDVRPRGATNAHRE